MDFVKSLVQLGVGALSAVLLTISLAMLSLARAFKIGLITPEFFVHAAATVIAMVALWKLLAGEFRVSAKLGAMALVGFLIAYVSHAMPGTIGLASTSLRVMDDANAKLAQEIEARTAPPPHIAPPIIAVATPAPPPPQPPAPQATPPVAAVTAPVPEQPPQRISARRPQ